MLNKNHFFMLKTLLSSLIRRRSRILVALVGIAIGATVLLGMITLCYDIPRQMGKEFRSYGANLLFVPAGNQSHFTLDQVNQAMALLPDDKIVGVTPFRYDIIRSHVQTYTIAGIDFEQIQKTSPYWRLNGRWPTNDHEILIGSDIADYTRQTIGNVIPITGKSTLQSKFDEEMTIVGIVKTGRAEDGFVFMQLNALNQLLEDPNKAEIVEVSITAAEQELQSFVEQIKQQIPSIEPHIVKWVTQSETAVLGKLEALLYLVTFVILILTMICVATTMMTVVIERRKEIGLKKAIGANNRAIAIEFLAEGTVLGLIGGAIGAVCGLLFAQLIGQQVFGRSLAIELYLIPITMIISTLVTVIACLIPVRRAVQIEPALVLRGE